MLEWWKTPFFGYDSELQQIEIAEENERLDRVQLEREQMQKPIIWDALECPQGSEVWDDVRGPRATGSEIDRVLTPAKLEPSKQAKRYAIECACYLQGIATPKQPPTFAMERGTELEPEARREYESVRGPVQQIGFATPSENSGWGCSPDALVGEDGILEIKCPLEVETVVEYADAGVIPTKYRLQCQFSLWVLQRNWLDFFAYHPDFAFLCRCVPESKVFAAFEKYVPEFAAEVKRYSQLIEQNKLNIVTGELI